MSGLVALHRLAAARGDGLHPKLRELLEQRAAMAADPRVSELDAARGGTLAQAGACPRPPIPDFLPANVVRFTPPDGSSAKARTPSGGTPISRKGRTSCTSP